MTPHVLLIFQPRFEECTQVLKGILHYQRANHPWAVSLYDEMRAEIDPCCWVRSRKWRGVISRHTPPSLVQTCAQLRLPLVDLTDAPPVAGASKIRPDHHAVGKMGAGYFLERRFRHFAFSGYANHAWSVERREGFCAALAAARQRCEVSEVELPAELTPTWEAKQIAMLAAWLGSLPSGTAVMACNDLRAQQVVRAAQVAGLRVPDEAAVLGANNDVARCELAELSISSVALNAFEAGRRAAERLTALMSDPTLSGSDERIPPLGVVTRGSTDVLGVRDENVAIALNYIREHACRGLTVDEVLRQVPVSRSNLEHKLRRYIGRSPQVEIRRVQVAKICQLLAETNLSIKEIAERAGFVHVEYMCVVFKRLTGDTPGQYRHKHVQTYEQPAVLV